MSTRREVEQAVLFSGLEPGARLVMLALLTKADYGTAVIPEEHSPSLSTLAGMTGFSRSSVAKWLNVLESGGWVTRDRPEKRTRDERTRYALHAVSSPESGSADSGGPESVPPKPDTAGGGGSDSGSPDSGSPRSGHAPKKSSSTKNSSSKRPSRRRTEEPPRVDVEAICKHLADKIEANGSKRPTITNEWRQQARLLLDEERPDPTDVAQIIALIDWCQSDDFWQSNVLSMPTFRKQYDRMRLKARKQWSANRLRGQDTRSETDWNDPSVKEFG